MLFYFICSYTYFVNSSSSEKPKNPVMKCLAQFRSIAITIFMFFILMSSYFSTFAQAPANDLCANAFLVTSSTTCVPYPGGGTLVGANPTAAAGAGCANANSADVWYKFTAITAYPVITINTFGNNFKTAKPAIQLLLNSCGPWNQVACVVAPNTTTTTLSIDTRTTPGGAGLTVGTTYLIRIYTNTATGVPAGTWTFNICITDPLPSPSLDYGKSYINLSKNTTGGTVTTGDILEIRATFVARDPNWSSNPISVADSLAFYDTLFNSKGFKLLAGANTITLKTNESKIYKSFTNAAGDDEGQGVPIGVTLDTAIRINFGIGASNTARGKLANNKKPSVFGSSSIVMATYRVQVYAPAGTKIKWGGGSLTYRDSITGVFRTVNFKNDSLIVYNSVGLCPNAISVANAIGVESNGTFGASSSSALLYKDRSASAYVPGYTYSPFTTNAPGDYLYGITNNTSAGGAGWSKSNTLNKPDNSSGTHKRVFDVWDITGDHTGATNSAKGNPPCDTTQPKSLSNPCGYMLVVNSAYKTDTAFQYSITGLCTNTYYELSAWIKNICSRCGCDSNGRTATNSGTSLPDPLYIPSGGAGDSSGVRPDLAFAINGTDYYTTGALKHYGAVLGITPQASDSMNQWVKRGFVYKTGPAETGFQLAIRNNAPGGGGNDWALDDIGVATCFPNMNYSPTNNPTVCQNNVITITDTIRSNFNNYTEYKWQRWSAATSGPWTDIAGTTGSAIPVFNPLWDATHNIYGYIVTYTIPVTWTTPANNGDLYRVVVATTTGNLASAACNSSDPVTITLNVLTSCGPPLAVNLLSVSGKLITDKAKISWVTVKEERITSYSVERSNDATNFTSIGIINGYNNTSSDKNYYSYDDPLPITGKVYYRIAVMSDQVIKKYSGIIQLILSGINGWSLDAVVNPFYNELQYQISSPVSVLAKIELLDNNGSTLRSSRQLINPGVNALTLNNTAGMPNGIYLLKVTINGNVSIRKIIKG